MMGCMGGWCQKRDRCAWYEPVEGAVIVERLCESFKYDCFLQIGGDYVDSRAGRGTLPELRPQMPAGKGLPNAQGR